MATTKPRADSSHALAVYLERLMHGGRVIVFGDPAPGLGELLVELGARAVVEVGPDGNLEADLSALRGRTFDLALVTDPASFGDAPALMATVRRMLGDEGVAVISAADTLDYYQLFDLVAGAFEDVRMVAELPFRGVALVELGREDSPVVNVDTQLAEVDRTPEFFIAVASRGGTLLDPYTIVELPPLAEVEPPAPIQAALTQERLRADALGAQLAELQGALEEERAEAEEGRAAVSQLEEAELRAVHAERVATGAEAELGRVVHAHVLELARLEETLRERALAIRGFEAEVVRRDGIIRELVDTLEEGATTAQGPAPAASVEPTPLTDELARENSILRWRLDALALELARRDAEAQAGEWAIQELQHELALEAITPGTPAAAEPAPSPSPPSGDEARRLASALAELDALRLALTQEHGARVLAESGEELSRARAEIQRQAVLLEQLRHELEATRHPREELR
jgi:hypothetical protein